MQDSEGPSVLLVVRCHSEQENDMKSPETCSEQSDAGGIYPRKAMTVVAPSRA
jgi:hypothetical protein